jgi:hypothetical protein
MDHQAIIVHLLREGEWYQAVLVYREETGAPRYLATREVKRIAQQHNIRLPISAWPISIWPIMSWSSLNWPALNWPSSFWFRSKQKSSAGTGFTSVSGKSSA